jgi:hypothetical protein
MEFYVGLQKSLIAINYAKHKMANMRLWHMLMDILKYVAELKIKNWASYIQDCNKWKLYVEKTKTFKDWSRGA